MSEPGEMTVFSSSRQFVKYPGAQESHQFSVQDAYLQPCIGYDEVKPRISVRLICSTKIFDEKNGQKRLETAKMMRSQSYQNIRVW